MFNSLKSKFPQISGAVISNPADIFYITGFYCEDCLLLLSPEPVLVTDSRYTVSAKAASCRVNVFSGSYIAGIITEAKAAGIATLCIQEEYLTAKDYIALKNAGFDLVEAGVTLTAMRAVKTSAELEKIKAAQKISDTAFNSLLEYIKPGMTEKQIKAKLEYLMLSLGADGFAFDTIVASGINGAKPHAVPTDKKVEKGEFITIDFGARLDNYNSDMTRTFSIGDVSPQLKAIYSTVLSAHNAALEYLKAGLSCSEADLAARNVMEKNGYAQYFTHSLGHGVGIEIHEAPRLSQKCSQALEVGNVVTVEPGIYIEGLAGVRIENMYAITRNGYENLTVSDKNLIKL